MPSNVSIVIPVYNAARYLKPCVESLLSQTMRGCEFIFVNDGSTDSSRAIIESYMETDSRIILLNQDNQGVSSARNAGIRAASGTYVAFVDADDTVDSDMYEIMYEAALESGCDIVITNFESQFGPHKVVVKYPFEAGKVLFSEEINAVILPHFVRSDDCHTSCNKLYRREMLAMHELSFPLRVALGEDGIFNMEVFSHAQCVIYVDYTGYHYRESEGSATRNIAASDYFARAVEVLESPLPYKFEERLRELNLHDLKAVRFIRTVTAILHMYMEPHSQLNFRTRAAYVRRMLNSPQVRAALPHFYQSEYPKLGRYQRLMTDFMRSRNIGGIYLMTLYSRIRNK
ncbi:glycosyltransferase family 2 protein [Paenibacillus sp. sgz500958]|uniref:glycosyltransferase family 2 protein n=1 Tax=Paenibacillus sp. sgz500958 TaxID=3242475 RepID=UPI0036D4319E